jgi:hypothetical protein
MGGGHVGWKWWKWWKWGNKVIVLNQPGQIGAVVGNHVDMFLMGCRREGQQREDSITIQQGQEGHLTIHACDYG